MKIKIRNNRIYFSDSNYWLFLSAYNAYLSDSLEGIKQDRYEFFEDCKNKITLILYSLSNHKVYKK